MGLDYSALTVFGVRLQEKDLYVIEKRSPERGCEHPATDAKFCSQCGQLTWKDRRDRWTPILLYDEFEAVDEFDAVRINNYGIVYVGRIVSVYRDDEPEFGQVPDMEALKKRMQEKLEPHGLWNEKQFGVWTVLQCS